MQQSKITTLFFSNSSSNAEGVALYVLNHFKFYRRLDLEFNSFDSENVFIEITPDSGKVFVISVVYRHPTNKFDEFQQQFLQTVDKLEKDKREFLICGDFNIDLLKHIPKN